MTKQKYIVRFGKILQHIPLYHGTTIIDYSYSSILEDENLEPIVKHVYREMMRRGDEIDGLRVLLSKREQDIVKLRTELDDVYEKFTNTKF